MKLIALHPSGTYEIVECTSETLLKTLQTQVGGQIELLMPSKRKSGSHCAYVNESGALERLRNNYYAVAILEKLGYVMQNYTSTGALSGVVVLCGTNSDGDDATLSEKTIEAVREYHEKLTKKRDESPERVDKV